VFSCFNQDQPLDSVDFANLHERLGMNSVLEKATARWLARLLGRGAEAPAPPPERPSPAPAPPAPVR